MRDRLNWQINWQDMMSKHCSISPINSEAISKAQRLGKGLVHPFLRLALLAIAISCLILGQGQPVQAQSVDELKNYQNFVDQQRQI
ncbi:MAG: hypothetical protein ACKPCM_16205, partial [Pseudanabaena sp.]